MPVRIFYSKVVDVYELTGNLNMHKDIGCTQCSGISNVFEVKYLLCQLVADTDHVDSIFIVSFLAV